jgi:SAM-dependent methyltransferase
VTRPDNAIAAMHRLLKPGGRLVAEFGGKNDLQAIISAVDGACRSILKCPFESPFYFPGIGEYSARLDAGGFETVFAQLLDHPTPLKSADGARKWLQMYLPATLSRVQPAELEAFFQDVEGRLRRTQWHGEQGWIDYRRLRIIAVRSGAN